MNVLIVGEADSANLGDQAIHVTLRRLFESQGHRVRGWDLSRGSYCRVDAPPAAAGEPATGAGALKARLLAVIERSPNSLQRLAVFLSRKRAFLRRRRLWAQQMRDHDLVVFGGGALLMDNNWSFPLGLAHTARAVRDAGRPYVCIGCSTGTHFSHRGRRWLQEFLDGCSFIALRDERSRDGLARIGDYDAAVYADSALSLRTVLPQPAARSAGRLGINLIAPVRSARLGRRIYDNYLTELARVIRRLGANESARWSEVVLFGTGEERDHEAARQFLLRPDLGSTGIDVRVQPRPQSLEALTAAIAGFDLVVSTRMHAGIISKSYRVPLIAVGWDRKIRGFCEMIGIEAEYFDIEECRAPQLLEAIERLERAGLQQADRVGERLLELAALPGLIEELMERNKER